MRHVADAWFVLNYPSTLFVSWNRRLKVRCRKISPAGTNATNERHYICSRHAYSNSALSLLSSITLLWCRSWYLLPDLVSMALPANALVLLALLAVAGLASGK